MIEFTIKTLDSNNHQFSVDDEITVQQLKEKVRDTMGIDIHLQRLIFCGRVLQDDKKLAEYDVQGKVLHLVQRAPPSPESRQPSSSTNSANPDQNGGTQQQLRRLMAMATPAGFLIEDRQALTLRPALTPTTGRLEFIQRMLGEVRSSLAALRLHVSQERSGEPGSDTEVDMDNEPSSSAPPDEPPVDLDDTTEDAPDAAARASNARRSGRSYRAIRALRARHARPRDLAQLLEELGGLQECFAPYRTRYIRMLQNANNPAILSRATDEERERDQRTVDMVNDIMHSLAHAYHALSDITFTVNQRNPRLTSEPSIVRHPIPMQAHINVVQSNRRPQQQPNNGASAPATQTSANTVPPPEAPNNQNNQPAPDNAQAGRNPTQASVNINVQPDPVTYQVEIETRLPIAFALDNAMIHGLNPSATVNQPPQPQQPEQNQQQPNRNGQPNQAAPNAAAGQPGQANRRQVLFDFENLFRGLGQGASLGGVEVVMSMEEIPQTGNVTGGGVGVGPTPAAGANPAPTAAAPTAMPQVDGGNPQPLFGADIYLGAMPWGGAPSADLLQNIVSSVIRQGLVPGVEGIAVHAMPPQAAQAQTQAQTQGQGETPAPEQLPNGTQGNQEQANQNGQPRQPNLHLRRATTTTRAQAVSLNNLFYDRYLSCDSNYARRRREQYQARQAAQERQRAERVAAQSIETLTYHNEHITDVHMQTLLQLLNGAPSREAWFNALMVAIARQLFMPDIIQARPGETALIPSEFPQLRQMLRSSIEDLIERSGEHEGETSYQTVADFLVHQHLYFLNRMDSMSPQRRDIDVYNSILSLIRCRLPAVISAVMSDSSTETQVARFYRVFSRLFTDLCALVAYCCEDGSEGLRDIAAYYLEEFVQSLPQSTSRLLVTLGMENMNALMVNMPIHIEAIMTYVRRRENYRPLIQTQQTPDQSPMELSPETNETEELMQTSPPSTPSLTQDTETSTSSDETTEGSTTCPVHAPVSNRTQTVTSGSLAAAEVPTTQAPTIQTQRTPKPEKSESPEAREETDSNVRFVPPVLLVQHWGEEWVPVFTRDQQVQSPEPQEPYSDAYLSGMPSRKRRCLRQARPSASLDGFMNESVREAAERTPTTDNSSIRSAFREHMRNMARSRASNSDEYDPQRYASAERFLNPTKSDKPDPESSSD